MKRNATSVANTVLVAGMMLAFPVSGADMGALPAELSQGNVRYVTGGVDSDQADAFKRAAPNYPLELLFAQKATPRDVYLADIKVTTRDRSSKVVLNATADGPFLLARLPAGKYQIEADNNGAVKRQAVDILAGKHRRVVFVWDADSETNRPVESRASR